MKCYIRENIDKKQLFAFGGLGLCELGNMLHPGGECSAHRKY